MPSIKIAVIGAGSASFGLSTLSHLVACEKLRGSELALVDTNADGLVLMRRLAERMNADWGARMTISATTNRGRPSARAPEVPTDVQMRRRW